MKSRNETKFNKIMKIVVINNARKATSRKFSFCFSNVFYFSRNFSVLVSFNLFKFFASFYSIQLIVNEKISLVLKVNTKGSFV